MSDPETHRGSCACGQVAFVVRGELPRPDACHCTLCRKQSGHYFVSSDVPRTALTIERGEAQLTWFHSSPKVRRGFCRTCGSSLLWDPIDHTKNDWIGVAMGAFDGATSTSIAVHIHVATKGDYYELPAGVKQNPG